MRMEFLTQSHACNSTCVEKSTKIIMNPRRASLKLLQVVWDKVGTLWPCTGFTIVNSNDSIKIKDNRTHI